MDNINEINDQLATLRAKKATIKEMINQLKQEISDRLNVLEASEENTSAEIRKIKQEMSEMMLARKQARPFIRRMNEYLHLLGYHARLSNERAKQIDVLDLESKE